MVSPPGTGATCRSRSTMIADHAGPGPSGD